jgi:hypothetical protein
MLRILEVDNENIFTYQPASLSDFSGSAGFEIG